MIFVSQQYYNWVNYECIWVFVRIVGENLNFDSINHHETLSQLENTHNSINCFCISFKIYIKVWMLKKIAIHNIEIMKIIIITDNQSQKSFQCNANDINNCCLMFNLHFSSNYYYFNWFELKFKKKI